MNNKVLVNICVPELSQNYDVFLPINEIVWRIIKLTVKVIGDLSYEEHLVNKNFILVNRDTGNIYNNNDILYNTDIRQATQLVLICIREKN